jgi:hypothetical protein
MSSPPRQPEYRGVVQSVINDGKHGSYAVAKSDLIEGSITFSLEPEVWTEEAMPREGFEVILGDVRRKRAGWRAYSARFVRPTDRS